jgi:hypothetical protein
MYLKVIFLAAIRTYVKFTHFLLQIKYIYIKFIYLYGKQLCNISILIDVVFGAS